MFGFDEDTSVELLENLGLDASYKSTALKALIDGDSRYIKDLRVNINNALDNEYIDEKESILLAIAIASNANNEALLNIFIEKAKKLDISAAFIAEAVACASLLASNNVAYRFRHFMSKEKYDRANLKIKMNIMARPVTGKAFFELMSLAVSAVNGCEMCVVSHEKSLLALEVSEARIWEAVRLSAVITSLSKIIY